MPRSPIQSGNVQKQQQQDNRILRTNMPTLQLHSHFKISCKSLNNYNDRI